MRRLPRVCRHWRSRAETCAAFKRHLSADLRPPQQFRYAPLDHDRNEIRLLTVLPATNHECSEELQCSLTHCSLDHPPQYHALSYAWRDDDLFSSSPSAPPSEDIIINNSRLTVGQNLTAALRARRSHAYRTIPLWVDAICINQDGINERSGQILRMRGIYARASKVTVWLGPERHASNTAIRFIRNICDKARELEGWAKDGSSPGAWTRDSAAFAAWFRESLISRRYSTEWRALRDLLRRAWWRRIWIVQEMIAAKEVEFFCGGDVLDPASLAEFLDLLVEHGVMYLPLLSNIEGIILEYDTFSLARTFLRRETWRDVSLLQALYRTGMALSSEPRDKIYAVLNLAKDGDAIVPRPDYSLSIQQIYRNLVMSVVKETGRLDILSLAALPVYPRKLDITLPTWTPDWTYRVTNAINSSIADVKPVWTDNKSSAIATFDVDGKILTARGFIIDTVDGLAHCIGSSARGISNPQLQQSTSVSSRYTDANSDAIDAIWRSLIADLIPANQSARSLFLRQCRNPNHSRYSSNKPHTLRNWYKHNQNFIVAGRSIKDWVTDTRLSASDPDQGQKIHTDDDDDAGPADFFSYRLPSHWMNRRFLTTRSGFVGLGPNTCVPGDVVCVIFGCCTPMILRAVGGHFEVVGEGYLQGIMHGEAMVELDAGGYVAEEFEIW